jgi:carboxymethylenebutenolidase
MASIREIEMAEIIDFRIGSDMTTAMVARPAGRSSGAGIVLAFHQGGLDNITEWMADEAALAGFTVIAPNHYHVLPPGVGIPDRLKYLTDEQITEDLKTSANWLCEEAGVDPKRLALMGTCMGGRITLMGLETLAGLWQCGCIWYGGNSFKKLIGELPAPASAERLRLINCPIAGFYGNLDQNPPPEDVDRLDTLLTELGKEHVFYRYPKAGHGFIHRFAPQKFKPVEAADSWSKAMAFLGQHLGVELLTA